MEAIDLGAFFVERLGGGLGFGALLGEVVLGLSRFLLALVALALERLDLRAQRDDLDPLAVADHSAVAEFIGEAGEFGFLIAQPHMRVVDGTGLDRVFLLGGADLVLERCLARFQGKYGGGFLAEIAFEAVDGVGFLAEIGELAGGFRLELFDAHFEPSRRHREFGAELILVGLDFGH